MDSPEGSRDDACLRSRDGGRKRVGGKTHTQREKREGRGGDMNGKNPLDVHRRGMWGLNHGPLEEGWAPSFLSVNKSSSCEVSMPFSDTFS